MNIQVLSLKQIALNSLVQRAKEIINIHDTSVGHIDVSVRIEYLENV